MINAASRRENKSSHLLTVEKNIQMFQVVLTITQLETQQDELLVRKKLKLKQSDNKNEISIIVYLQNNRQRREVGRARLKILISQ